METLIDQLSEKSPPSSRGRGGGRSQLLVRPDSDQNLFITGKSTTLCGPTLCGPFDHYRANYWPDQGRGGRAVPHHAYARMITARTCADDHVTGILAPDWSRTV